MKITITCENDDEIKSLRDSGMPEELCEETVLEGVMEFALVGTLVDGTTFTPIRRFLGDTHSLVGKLAEGASVLTHGH